MNKPKFTNIGYITFWSGNNKLKDSHSQYSRKLVSDSKKKKKIITYQWPKSEVAPDQEKFQPHDEQNLKKK